MAKKSCAGGSAQKHLDRGFHIIAGVGSKRGSRRAKAVSAARARAAAAAKACACEFGMARKVCKHEVAKLRSNIVRIAKK